MDIISFRNQRTDLAIIFCILFTPAVKGKNEWILCHIEDGTDYSNVHYSLRPESDRFDPSFGQRPDHSHIYQESRLPSKERDFT